MDTYTVVRMSDNKACKVQAVDGFHALTIVVRNQHGFNAARDCEYIPGTDGKTVFAYSESFHYATSENLKC